MTHALLIAIDLVAICLLAFGLYFPRHRRRDLLVAFLCVNIGVMAVAQVLSTAAVGVGVGLGLFGVLSIIRLRSYEIGQHEVAYYFASLALGLLAGMTTTLDWFPIAMMALIVLVIFVGDHPALLRNYRQQDILLDRAIAEEGELVDHLERMLGARVHRVTVQELDTVNDTTAVNVRYELATSPSRGASASTPAREPVGASPEAAGALR
jgi:uncharacterized membrane protein YhiD involved in acid resistance